MSLNLNEKQKEAVEYLMGPLLVLAGPGTGKTQLLSRKVEYILENTDTNPENILCITFTDNAATNMRERLSSVIGKAANNVNIGTYHSLGIDILYQYQNYNPRFARKLDEVISEIQQYKIIKKILAELPAGDILKTNNVKDVITTIAEAKRARLTAEDLGKIAEFNLSQSEELNSKLTPILERSREKGLRFLKAVETIYEPVLEVLSRFTSPRPIVKNIEREANYLARTLKEAIETEEAKEKPSMKSLTGWRNQNFELDENGAFRFRNVVANRKLLSIAVVMEKYSAYLTENGFYDFNDMIELAITALKNDHGFQLTLEERYQYILLDEFQDTNPSQFELIRLLTDYEKPVVMAVGDDDQAIFAFQGANASNLIDFQEHYKAKVITLKENYRSTQEILDFSRKIADQLSESFAKQHHIDKQLIARGSFSEKEIVRHEFLSTNEEYDWVAEKIAELIRAGVKQTEIAIIAPKHKYLLPLLPYLKERAEIEIAYEKRENIFEDEKVGQILKLARFIEELAEEKTPGHLVLEILALPFFEVPPIIAIQEVQKARREKKSVLAQLAESENQQLSEIANFISRLVVLSFETPVELFLDYLIGTVALPDTEGGLKKSPFLDYYQRTEEEFKLYELYEYLSSLREAVKNQVKGSKLKLKDLVEFLDDCKEAGYALTSTSPYKSAEQAVQLLSGHKSKGLEFKYVFLIAVNDRAWGNEKGNNNLLSLPKNLIQIRHTGATDDECLRLFFVALTRAKTHLFLTNAKADFTGKITRGLEYLMEHTEKKEIDKKETEILVSPLLPKNQQIIRTHQEALDPEKIRTNLQLSWAAAYQKLTPDFRALLLEHLKNYRLTATDLTMFIDIQYAGPAVFYRRKVLCEPAEPANFKMVLGNLIHEVLDLVTKEKLNEDAALAVFQNALSDITLNFNDRREVEKLGSDAIRAVLRKFGELLRAPGALSEVDLRGKYLKVDDLVITGKIDHIDVDRENKIIKIYDFKTGKHHAPSNRSGWKGYPSLYKYALQLEFYRLLLKTTPEYANYKITEGHILFVLPDEEGRIFDEKYEFTEKSAEEFLELSKTVFREIRSLDFLDRPELIGAEPIGKGCSMKEFLEFLETIRLV